MRQFVLFTHKAAIAAAHRREPCLAGAPELKRRPFGSPPKPAAVVTPPTLSNGTRPSHRP